MSDAKIPEAPENRGAVFRHCHDYRHDVQMLAVYFLIWFAVYFFVAGNYFDVMYFFLIYGFLVIIYAMWKMWEITGIDFGDESVTIHRRIYSFRLDKNRIAFVFHKAEKGSAARTPVLLINRPGLLLPVKINKFEFKQFDGLLDYLKTRNMVSIKP